MKSAEEFNTKMDRIAQYCSANALDGVVLSNSDAFAWLGCGADSTVNTASEGGVASLVAIGDKCWLVTNNIESRRLQTEELAGVPLAGVEVFDWWQPTGKAEAVKRLVQGHEVAADDGLAGLPVLDEAFAALRWSLTVSECGRYRTLGEDASEAMEETCFSVERGMTEADIAGLMAEACRQRGINPVVLLVAVDDRIRQWRHPIVKMDKLDKYAMIVICGRRGGQIAAVTRLVSLVEPSEDLKKRHEAVCFVDASMICASRPGREVREVFQTAQKAYAARGFDGEWQLHHQGGAIGYQPREYIANPEMTTTIRQPQAFAWNPSIQGTKSEDTVLVTEDGFEILTAASEQFPTLKVEVAGQVVVRPDILVQEE